MSTDTTNYPPQNNQDATSLQETPKAFPEGSPYRQAVAIQRILTKDIGDPKTTPSVRAALARAWDVLEERKRILRGRPLPGQLRPDLDPVQMAKALKRSKQRLIHDIGPSFAEPKEEPPPKTPSTGGEQPPPAG